MTIEELYKQGLTYKQIAERVGKTRAAVRCYITRQPYYNPKTKPIEPPQEKSQKVIGVFGDVHIPFHHPNYLQFLVDTFTRFGVDEIVCTGDLVDHHALSRFQSEPCAKGAYDELDASITAVKQYTDAFPDVRMCRGNHDSIPIRQAATVGLGDRYLKSLHEVVKLPDTWELQDEYIIDNVFYKHGLNCGGKDGALNAAITERMSTVIGHYHAFAGCKYAANKRSLIFGMNVGCGVDVSAYAFAYGKNAKYRPVLGCGIVFSDSKALFIPMDEKYFRSVGEETV